MLDGLFKPKGIAVIGASANPLSIGHMVLKNILDQGYKHPVYPVNPKTAEILSLKAYKSVLDIPGEVDLANISIKNTFVPLAVEECGKKGVKFAIVHTAGFKEIGDEGAKLEEQIVEIAHKYGMRIYGPNSQGIENSDKDVRVYANFTFTPMTEGNISVLAQSGGVGEVLQLHLDKIGVGFRMYASYGNEADVSMNEILEYYGQDDGTRVIMLHIETLKDPAGFLKKAAAITRKKPILAVKSGKTREGLKAVSSHTGTLMEKDVTTDVLFKKAGVVRFDTQDEMIQAAVAFSSQPEPKGNRVAIVTNTGGPGILAVDECVLAGLELAKLAPETEEFLRERLYPEASLANPVDVLATATPEHYGAAIAGLMKDPNVDSILISFITAQFVDLEGIAATVAEWGRKAVKPLICVIMTIAKWGGLIETIRAGGVPVYEFPETGARALVNMTRYGTVKHAALPEYPTIEVNRTAVAEIFARRAAGYLSQADAFGVLAAYGIPCVKTGVIANAAALEAAVQGFRFPVVLKVDAGAVVHKSEAGGVAMGIKDAAALRGIFEEMDARFKEHDAAFIVQEQLPASVETIVGTNNTEDVGPLIMFGLGGVLVEVMKDVQFRMAPLAIQDAEEMIRAIQGYPVLQGVRGRPAADIDSLVDILLKVSRLASDFPEIEEMDLNPIFSFGPGEGSRVVDVRLKRTGGL